MRFIFLAIVAALTASMPVSAIPAVFSRDSQCISSGQPCEFSLNFIDCCAGSYCYVRTFDMIRGICKSDTD
ncbi:uncharacterized protein EDB91DRAFT_1161233 [Suillus paluster]|uniref:uncharacterized protein n=1 Tax=Suillus paluster TaxID=48578 RepID=UPI001B867A38|nr:uncharacterized protein EDB91DRAFT_1161233 [Suillus paluster]KAG1728603.1 hypothetical protein EDB91DRAFT_1161233 [Suillus paluster]